MRKFFVRLFIAGIVLVMCAGVVGLGGLLIWTDTVSLDGLALGDFNLDNLALGDEREQPTEVAYVPTAATINEFVATAVPTQVTVVPTAVLPPPVATTDGCQRAAASGLPVSVDEKRAQAPVNNILPNGQRLPDQAAQQLEVEEGPVSNRVLIRFSDVATQRQKILYIRSMGGQVLRYIKAFDMYVVSLPGNAAPEDLPPSPLVQSIEADYQAVASQDDVYIPNDPRFIEQWALPVIGLPEGWSQVPEGSQVTVAVIDSGVCLSHPDLQGRFVAGYDFVDDDETPQDEMGHGCGVAGIIAANPDNGEGIVGVAPNAMIMPLRVLGADGRGDYSSIASAIVYAVNNGADVINLSLAGTVPSQLMADTIEYAIENGVIVVAASGNYGTDRPYYPAAFPSVVAVGSIDSNLQRSRFSNYGDHVTVTAPGRDILTTTPDGGYVMSSGTSFAAPHVAGLAAISETYNQPLNTEDEIAFVFAPEDQPQCP
jgi:subtilisin family serine protease